MGYYMSWYFYTIFVLGFYFHAPNAFPRENDISEPPLSIIERMDIKLPILQLLQLCLSRSPSSLSITWYFRSGEKKLPSPTLNH